jgi:hypothetical protein
MRVRGFEGLRAWAWPDIGVGRCESFTWFTREHEVASYAGSCYAVVDARWSPVQEPNAVTGRVIRHSTSMQVGFDPRGTFNCQSDFRAPFQYDSIRVSGLHSNMIRFGFQGSIPIHLAIMIRFRRPLPWDARISGTIPFCSDPVGAGLDHRTLF